MRIVANGHPALRKKSEPIEEITESIRELAQRMALTMLKNEVVGVGIAAPQVGINLRLIVVKTTGDDGRSRKDALPGELLLDPLMPVALVNPEIISASGETDTCEEGCLSLPGVSGNVTRPSRVVLRAQMLDGKTVTAECGGLLAQHSSVFARLHSVGRVLQIHGVCRCLYPQDNQQRRRRAEDSKS